MFNRATSALVTLVKHFCKLINTYFKHTSSLERKINTSKHPFQQWSQERLQLGKFSILWSVELFQVEPCVPSPRGVQRVPVDTNKRKYFPNYFGQTFSEKESFPLPVLILLCWENKFNLLEQYTHKTCCQIFILYIYMYYYCV